MKWIKKGLIYKPESKFDWMQTHAQVPFAYKLNNGRIRIYFGVRDKNNRTLPTFIEVNDDNPKEILYKHNKPILELGKLGCFDDSGVMPSWFELVNKKLYFYYVGWNIGITSRYRVALGLAISEDNGLTFKRYSDGPIIDRTPIEPISVSNNAIIIENDVWRMWYMSYVKWIEHDGLPEPYYIIKYAESRDGFNWNLMNNICIDLKSDDEGGIARPYVLKDHGIYKMWYSYRKKKDYRHHLSASYRIGYAESNDGIHWIRMDESAGINVSPNGWDSEMIAYPNVLRHKNKLYLFYNGNGFGKSGFGYAEMEIY